MLRRCIVDATGVSSAPRKTVEICSRTLFVVHRCGLGETASEIAAAFAGGVPEAAAATGNQMPYTFVIRRNGLIEQALPWTDVAPHARAYNARSASVALVGDMRFDAPTAEQWGSALELCTIAAILTGGASTIYGHDELAGGSSDPCKECPGVRMRMALLRDSVRESILRLCDSAGMIW